MGESMMPISEFRSLHVLQCLCDLHIIIYISSVERIPHQPIILPPRLKKFRISIHGVTNDPSDAVVRGIQQTLINAAAAVSTLTSLDLELSNRDVYLDCTPLINLVNLQYLSLSLSVRTGADAMNTVKRLPMLESLRVLTVDLHPSPHACTFVLRSLCSSPLPIKLAQLSLDWKVTAEHFSTLAQLPSLTELVGRIDPAAAPQLPLLTQLKKLDFLYGHSQPSGPFLPFIPQLHQLTDLTLYGCTMNGEQGVLIMTGCRQLSSLSLEHVKVERLNWLESGGEKLTYLSLDTCRGVKQTDLISILSLKALQKLSLDSTCRLDQFVVHVLTPPTSLLPNLTEFEYEEP